MNHIAVHAEVAALRKKFKLYPFELYFAYIQLLLGVKKMDFFGPLLVITVIFGVIFLVLTAMGIAVGYLLHWMISSISLEIGILIGVFSVNSAMYFFIKAFFSLSQYHEEQNSRENYISRLRSRYVKKYKDRK